MSKILRNDRPGTWHHVMNRSLARRPIFENREDVRYFLSRVAREVRRGTIELIAFSIMTTHFHLLVRSLQGQLSATLARICSVYSSYFNRRRKRDGPLFRGPFKSCPGNSKAYRALVVSYIDDNPVAAGIVQSREDYPYGSASYYAAKKRGPPWLSRTWIESEVALHAGKPAYRFEDYAGRFPTRLSADFRSWVERKLRQPRPPDSDIEDMVHASPETVRVRMERKAMLADGDRFPAPVFPPLVLLAHIDRRHAREDDSWRLVPLQGARPLVGVSLLRPGLLREECGLGYAEIAAVLRLPLSTVYSRCRQHRAAAAKNPEYAERVAEILSDAARSLQREGARHSSA